MPAFYVMGAAGHGREVAAVIRATEQNDPSAGELAGFLDDDPELHGQTVNGLPVLGAMDSPPEPLESISAALGVGYPEVKARIIDRLGERVGTWPAVVHPNASIGDQVEIGEGVFIQAGVVLTANIRVADFVTVNIGATVSHDCTLGRFATLSPGAHVGGNVELGEGAFVGIGASVVQGVSIGDWSVIGAGAMVLSDVPPNAVVVGVPARVLETRTEGWHLG